MANKKMQLQTEGQAWPEAYKGVAGSNRNGTLEDTNSDVLPEESGEAKQTVNFLLALEKMFC